MKLLILLSTIILSTSPVMAGFDNFIASSEYQKCKEDKISEYRFFGKKEECESAKGEECIEIESSFACQYTEVTEVFGDDLTKPVYSGRNEVESCQKEVIFEAVQEEVTDPATGETTTVTVQKPIAGSLPVCDVVLAQKVCSNASAQKYIDELYTQVYCTHIASYEQKSLGKKAINVESLKASFDAKVAQEKSLYQAMESAKKAQDCGRSTMAYMLVRNAPKGLSTSQVKQLVATYAPIKGLLESGSLVTAIEEIQAVEADGVLVTEADKLALVTHINSCK